MSFIQKKLQELADQKPKDRAAKKNRVKPITSGKTPDEILTNEDEVKRLSKYIDDDKKKKIINTKTAVSNGIDQIGTKNDSAGILKQLLAGASKRAKKFAANILVDDFAAKNLVDKIKTKTGDVIGKMISKNVYLKEVKYTRKGKMISYLQARNIKTGRVVGQRAVLSLIGRYRK